MKRTDILGGEQERNPGDYEKRRVGHNTDTTMFVIINLIIPQTDGTL